MDQSRTNRQKAVDMPSAIFAGAYLSGLNMLVVNLQPLILGTYADTYNFTDRQLGHISAIFLGFATLCSLTGPLWVRRVDWRKFSRWVIAFAVFTLACGAYVTDAGTVLVLFAVLGIVIAAFGIPAFASLGDGSNPDRNYGASVSFQGLLAAAVTAPAAIYIIPHFGLSGLFLTIAALVSSGLVISHWLPREGTGTSEAEPANSIRAISASCLPALIALCALSAFTASILGFWYFIERIGIDHNVPSSLIGISLSAVALASILTATLVAWLGERFSSLVYILTGSFLLIAGFGLMRVTGNPTYVTGAMIFALGWGLSQPAYYALVRKVDGTGRLFVASPAAGGIAGVFIGIAAGPIIEASGYSGLTSVCAALAVISALGAWIAIVFSRKSPLHNDQAANFSSSTPDEFSM